MPGPRRRDFPCAARVGHRGLAILVMTVAAAPAHWSVELSLDGRALDREEFVIQARP